MELSVPLRPPLPGLPEDVCLGRGLFLVGCHAILGGEKGTIPYARGGTRRRSRAIGGAALLACRNDVAVISGKARPTVPAVAVAPVTTFRRHVQHGNKNRLSECTFGGCASHSDDEEVDFATPRISTRIPVPQPYSSLPTFDLLPFNFANVVAGSLPMAAVVAQCGLPAGGPGVLGACMPLAVPFAVPYIAGDAWTGSKRAGAFQRSALIAVYFQGVFGVYKLLHGDLVGGLYDELQAVFGNYALTEDGIHLLPTYVLAAGFTGAAGLCKTYWLLHMIPLSYMPWMPYGPPVSSILGAYFSLKLCKEVRAIAMGYPSCGSEDSYFVGFANGDWWPANTLGFTRSNPARNNHNTFSGNGSRLGDGSART